MTTIDYHAVCLLRATCRQPNSRPGAKALRFRVEGGRHGRRNQPASAVRKPSDRSPTPEPTMAFSIDKSTLEKASRGDSASLETLVVALRPHIEKQLLRYPLSDDDRQDLVQSTLMQIVRRVGSFRGDSSFSTWLFRVTANEALMMMRSQRRHRARLVEGLDLEDLGSLPAANDAGAHGQSDRADANAAQNERDALVRAALDELPPEYRDVVALHYHHDLGLEEIAVRLSTTESAVRSRLHRARSRLRTILGKQASEIAAA
jgi:RNA polymerase sigma-70 factor (ECF subfamily)